MSITEKVFKAFLKCPTKSYLHALDTIAVPSKLSAWREQQLIRFQQTGWERLRRSVSKDELFVGTPPLQALEDQRYHVILDYVVDLPRIHTRLHALERSASACNTVDSPYVPVRFVASEKLTPSDKLLLAFDASAFLNASGKTPRIGKIIHGREHKTITVQLAKLIEKVRPLLDRITTQQDSDSPPPLVLNKHCPECEFQSRCRQIALDNDDLSLLSTITEKERKRQHEKGIFTLTQLSHTFRPRRRPPQMPRKREHALQALAIRKNQIHIFGTPTFEEPGTPVYIDVEGDPDRDFYYLIGLRIRSGDAYVQHSFWADDPAKERYMWADCLNTLNTIMRPRLVHYGSYETQFLKRMRSRYANIGSPAVMDQIAGSALNLLSVIYGYVYFPTYSNGLKELATYLGFRWSEIAASGLTALTWRSQWEFSYEPILEQKLLTYNAEDCEAAQKVTDALRALCQTVSSEGAARADVVNVDSLKREYPHRFGEVDFVLPEFQQINKAAYWDYQRNRVYVRSNRRLQRLSREIIKRQPRAEDRPNKTITVEEPRPDSCCHCSEPLIYKWGWSSQTVHDLRLSPTGVKRWVVRYSFPRYICWHCKATFHQYVRRPKYGVGLCAYLLYGIIEMQIPQNALAGSLQQLFGLPLSRGSVNKLKASQAGRYEATYRAILGRVATGKLVHVDETKAGIDDKNGYVWVFTNLEDVAFVYSETREASTVRDVLRNFCGVLVSDFYAAYDSIDFPQQKCLIHLIRDVNEDLCKQPFNEEMKDLAQEFARLLKPMIESVDRFGLRAYHLRKHKCSADRFLQALFKKDYQTEVAVSYKRRFEKNKARLFTFLDHDGVPWNNNNAEHAIKAFARLRRSIMGKTSSKGMQDYLMLLSICETCKYRGLSFLDYLRSGQMDINAFSSGLRVADRSRTMRA